jgi:hypothetical integral membrane protein (TIGR02206 family)
VVLAIFVAGTVAILVLGPRTRGTPAERTTCLVLAAGNLVFGAVSTARGLVPFDDQHSLPLMICSIAWLVVGLALLTGRPTLTALTYYWGLTLSVQALLQPTLTQPFPELDFFVFWAKHFCIIWGAVYLTLVLRHGPDWRAYRVAVGWTVVWLVGVMGVNAALGSNYGYLSKKPAQGTVLNWFGPWPGYVIVEAAVVCLGWALITLPWTGLPHWMRRRPGSGVRGDAELR